MEIKAVVSPKASPPPNFSFKKDSQDCWNAYLSQSDSVLLNWKLQRSTSPVFETEGSRLKKDGSQYVKKAGLRGKVRIIPSRRAVLINQEFSFTRIKGNHESENQNETTRVQ